MRLISPSTLQRDALLLRLWEDLGRPHCYLVGGYIRDRLLGRESVDVDLTLPTSVDEAASPARRFAEIHGVRAHLLGTSPRCVWRIETGRLKVELWPLGGLSVEQDIRRRDFTCNALVWRLPDGPWIDHVGGRDDLERRRLRAVSEGNLREDPVRLLRGPRFLANYDEFELEERTAKWIRELGQCLGRSPRERVGQELIQLLRARSASRGLAVILHLGLLSPAAPPAARPDAGWLRRHLHAADRLASASRHPVPAALKSSGDAARLALLLRAWGAPSSDEVAEYGWARPARQAAVRSAGLLDAAMEVVDGPSADRRELMYRAGGSFPALLAVGAAVAEPEALPSWKRWWRQWLHTGQGLVQPKTLLTADEVVEVTGVPPGPALGQLIRRLHLAQVRGEVRTAGGAKSWLQKNR